MTDKRCTVTVDLTAGYRLCEDRAVAFVAVDDACQARTVENLVCKAHLETVYADFAEDPARFQSFKVSIPELEPVEPERCDSIGCESEPVDEIVVFRTGDRTRLCQEHLDDLIADLIPRGWGYQLSEGR